MIVQFFVCYKIYPFQLIPFSTDILLMIRIGSFAVTRIIYRTIYNQQQITVSFYNNIFKYCTG